ncbi:MAG: ATP-binding protein [Cyclobacteriaceae bacterium]
MPSLLTYIGYPILVIAFAWFYFSRTKQLRARLKQEISSRLKQERFAETSRSLLEQETKHLLEVNNLKTRFISKVLHEFKTPLSLIIGPLKAYEREGSLKPEMVRLIYRNAQRMNRLTNEVLDVSRIESGKLKLDLRKAEFNLFLKDIYLTFLGEAERKGIEYQFMGSSERLICYFDEAALEKVFYNILSNALKFTNTGKITVSVQTTTLHEDLLSRSILVKIRDSGIGIEEQDSSKVFDHFYQVDSSRKFVSGGTGVGLSLAKELVELHKGKIWVDSEVGKGSVFSVEIPMVQTGIDIHEMGENVELVSTDFDPEVIFEDDQIEYVDRNKPLLLLVEDHPDLAEFVKTQLKRKYNVIRCKEGKSGIEKAQAEIPDLIISDVMMPDRDGFELCDALKKDARTSHIPIILLTVRSSEKSKLTGLRKRADDYIVKPFSIDELMVRVDNLLRQRTELKKHFKKSLYTESGEMKIKSIDDQFISDLRAIVKERHSNGDFGVEVMEEELGISRRNLQRKMKALLDTTPIEFIKEYRLKRATQLLEQRSGNISEIAYRVGFNSAAYFTAQFKERFNKTPSEFATKPK